MVLRDGLYQDVEKWLAAGEIDCGFTNSSTSSEFEFVPLRSEPLLAVLPKDHPLARQKCVTLKELSVLPFIVPGEGTNYENLAYTVKLNSEEYGVGFRKGSDIAAKFNEFLAAAYADGSTLETAKLYGVQESIIAQ